MYDFIVSTSCGANFSSIASTLSGGRIFRTSATDINFKDLSKCCAGIGCSDLIGTGTRLCAAEGCTGCCCWAAASIAAFCSASACAAWAAISSILDWFIALWDISEDMTPRFSRLSIASLYVFVTWCSINCNIWSCGKLFLIACFATSNMVNAIFCIIPSQCSGMIPECTRSIDLWNAHSAIIWVTKIAWSALKPSDSSFAIASPARSVKFERVFTT